ncbi:MAG: hypothetical protein LWX00_10215 [Spirochaetia bacterium]|nr:hypothetical protein [Spirochaetia bacterium]
MADKKLDETQKAEKEKKNGSDLEPCTTSHSPESTRPNEEEDACDEGVH